ncbi:hypothetical protein SISSUDRAFT_463713 [Sistotremastrum suecicum HHB10207 ss-3]|uniref:Uncharacterized protein n=1 Tax=Sistotremastrum suecicum HHB10207 ss-3 TaxID=1314776 RepID=A0A166FDS2_9AGAM|nr:hypothetical protein SISSUDRAFT_463713 [Sistotremastrum suecicum HHB10207 ss-3]
MLEELVLKRKRGEGTPKRPECLSSDFDEDEEDRETEARVVKKRFPSGLGVPSTLRPTTFSSPSVGTNVQPSIFIKKPAVDWSSVPLGRSSSSMNTSQSQPTPAPASREISIEASKLINSDYAHHIFGGKQRTRRRRRHKPSNASYSDSKDRRSTQGLRHAGHAESHERTSISESERHALTTLNEERAFANSLHGSAPALSGNGESHEEYDTEASESDSEDSDASYSSFPPDDDRSMISNATRRDDENDENVLISPMPPPDPPKDDIPTTPDDPEKRMPNVPLSLVCPQWPRSLPKAGRVRSDGPPRYYPTREAEKAEATMASLITKSFEAQDTYDRINEIISAGAADSMELSGRPVDPQTNPATTSKILEPVSPEALEATYPSNPQREGADQEELKDSSRKTSPVPTPSHSEAMSDGLSSDRTLTPRPSERRKTALPSSLQVTLPHHSKHDLQLGDVSSPLDTVSRRSLAEFSDANTYRHLSTMQADALKEQRVAAKSTKRAPPLQENEPNKSESVVHCEPETGPRSEYPMVSSTQNQSPLLSVEVHQGLSVKLVEDNAAHFAEGRR